MSYPSSKVAPTGRAKCIHCGEKVEKGSVKIEVERTVETPRGERVVAASLHPACAAAWVGESDWPGGIAAFAQAVLDNGAEPVDELAEHLGADATKPRGDLRELSIALESLHCSNPADRDELVEFITAHRWEHTDFKALSAFHKLPPEIIRLLIEHAVPHQRERVRLYMVHKLAFDWKIEQKAEWLHPLVHELSTALDIGALTPSDRHEAVGRALDMWGLALNCEPYGAIMRGLGADIEDADAEFLLELARSFARSEPFAKELRDRAPAATRVEALWMAFRGDGRKLLGRDWEAGPGLEFLVGELAPDSDWQGRKPIHIAAMVGRPDLVERFGGPADAPLGADIEGFHRWLFGPAADHRTDYFEPRAGDTPAALVNGMLGQTAQDGAVDLRPRYEETLAALRAIGANVDAGAQKPVATADAATSEGAKEVELEWLREHLDECADDVFDEVLRFQRAYAKDGGVFVDFTITSRGDEPGSASIEWPAPEGHDDAKVLELIDEIADAQYG